MCVEASAQSSKAQAMEGVACRHKALQARADVIDAEMTCTDCLTMLALMSWTLGE